MKKVALVSLAVLFLTACGDNSNSTTSGAYKEDRDTGNPYSKGTGHYAGYEWAERNGGNCNGNSQSFNEGCEEYYYQTER